MKSEPLIPAEIEWRDDGVPLSPRYGDIYHPAAGALQQGRHVFLAGNDLPARWAGREHFVVLETGFGLGNNFLATWAAWRDSGATGTLHFLSVEAHPPRREDLARVSRDPSLAVLARQLEVAWPPLTPDLHRLAFDDNRVQLLLALGPVSAWLPELVASVDAFYLDGFAPARNPQMWEPRVIKALARLAAPGATLATWSAARSLREGLSAAGFTVTPAAGAAGKRDITLARYAPAFEPRRAPSRLQTPAAGERRAVIVGGGLAGCATAAALAESGWQSTLIERHDAPAYETSGNPGGMFHGIVNPQDGAHARFNRAAAMHAGGAVRAALSRGGVAGSVDGLLRLETSGDDAQAMRQVLLRLGLPPQYVQVLSADEASRAAGVRLQHPAWFYPDGGWVQPAAFARSLLDAARDRVQWRGGVEVETLRHDADGWQLLDASGTLIEECAVVILANAGDALRLIGRPPWPVEPVRGQISFGAASAFAPEHLASLPIAGSGYVLPPHDGRVVFGATAIADDADTTVRREDHLANLAQLAGLLGREAELDVDALEGRTGRRWVADDRLPIVGAVPDTDAVAQRLAERQPRLDQPRFVPRRAGLFVCTALAFRGIGWATLCARVVASQVAGTPSPLEAGLLDAIDPARFVARAVRRPRD